MFAVVRFLVVLLVEERFAGTFVFVDFFFWAVATLTIPVIRNKRNKCFNILIHKFNFSLFIRV